MLETVAEPPSVISRLARSKDHLFPSFLDSQNLTSKLSFLGNSNPLGLFSSHRRVHSELDSPAPSFRDYFLLSGGGLEPAFKTSPDGTSSRPTGSASSRRNSSLTLNESQISGTSINEFSDRESEVVLTNSSYPALPLTPPATPTAERREASNSRSSIFSILISTLHVPKATRGHYSGRPETPAAVDECNQLRFVSITSTSSSRMDFSLSSPGAGVRDSTDTPATIFEMKFSPPSFIRPRGRRLIARREPSPMIYSPSMESLKLNKSAHSHNRDRCDEGIALSRSSAERDMIPEEDESIEEGQMSPLYHKARHNQLDRKNQLSPDNKLPRYSQKTHQVEMELHNQAGPRERTKPRLEHFNHTQISQGVSITSRNWAGSLSQMSHDPQMTRHVQMPQIPEHDQPLALELGPESVLVPAPEQDKMTSPGEETYMQKIVHQIDSIVELAAIDDNSKSEWRTYMANYSKGSFNISIPPVPPPASSKLQYLPSIFPRTEADRISVFNGHRLEWNTLIADKLSDLLVAVMVKFGLNSGAISFFNNKYEYIKAERGYNARSITRSNSIAAHGLLSADVFVVPDTQKDWRFQGHPLVVSHPRIRFFAGAPLLGDSGQPIGILSVFSNTLRPDFTPFDRRELADFAAQAMKDLISGSDYDRTPTAPTTTIFETSPIAIDGQEGRSLDVARLENTDKHCIAPNSPSVCYTRPETPSTRFNNGLISHENSLQRIHRPLSRSSRSNLRAQNEFDRQKYDQYSGPGMDSTPALYKMDALSISEFAPSSPRPFSSSDVSSIHKHPTNTPVHSQAGFPRVSELDFTLQLLRSLGAEYPEDAPDNDSQTFMSNNKITAVSPHNTNSRSPTPDSSLSSHLPELRDVFTAHGLDDASIMSSSRPASREDARAEAALICSRTARRLGYDLIYAVELNPALDAIDETKILEPGMLPISILAAYGMNEPFRPDPQVHIDALRSKGFYYWQAPPNANNATGGYHSGCLIAIPTQGGVQHLRTSGIVIGAFRKAAPGKGVTFETTEPELQALMDAGHEVKSLFWATPDDSPRQARYESHAGFMTEAYPAREAVRVRAYPVSPYPRSLYSANRQENRSGSPYPYHKYAQKQLAAGSNPHLQDPARQLFNKQQDSGYRQPEPYA